MKGYEEHPERYYRAAGGKESVRAAPSFLKHAYVLLILLQRAHSGVVETTFHRRHQSSQCNRVVDTLNAQFANFLRCEKTKARTDHLVGGDRHGVGHGTLQISSCARQHEARPSLDVDSREVQNRLEFCGRRHPQISSSSMDKLRSLIY